MSLSISLANSLNRSCAPIRRIPGTCVRFMTAGRENCMQDKSPRCGSERLSKTPCGQEKAKGEEKPKSQFSSMWENPDCCKDPCPDVLPRFDELYYVQSDKAKRQYMQTWVECPEFRIVPKKICCYEQLGFPPLERRKTSACRPKTACTPSDDAKLLMKCQDKRNMKCPKITLPGCRGARDPPKCKKERGPSDCKKICTPYPSYSECQRPPIKPKRPVECNCLTIASMCDVWAEYRKRLSQK